MGAPRPATKVAPASSQDSLQIGSITLLLHQFVGYDGVPEAREVAKKANKPIVSAQEVSLNPLLGQIHQYHLPFVVASSLNIKIVDDEGKAVQARKGYYIVDPVNRVWKEISEEKAFTSGRKWSQIVYLDGPAAEIINCKEGELLGALLVLEAHYGSYRQGKFMLYVGAGFGNDFVCNCDCSAWVALSNEASAQKSSSGNLPLPSLIRPTSLW